MATKKKQIIDIGIKTDFLDKSQLESYQKSLVNLKKNAREYGVNLNSVNAALGTISEILNVLPKSGKVNVQQTTQLKNLYADLSNQASRLAGQVNNKDFSKELKEINDNIEKQKKIINDLVASQKKLNKERTKLDTSEAAYGIKQNKKNTGRRTDTKAESLWRKSEQAGADIISFGKQHGYSDDDIETAVALQQKYHDEFVKYNADIQRSLVEVTNKLATVNVELSKSQNILDDLNAKRQVLETGSLTEEQESMVQTIGDLGTAANTSQQHMANLNIHMKETGQTTADLTKKTEASTDSFGRAAKAVFNYSIVYKTIQRLFKEAINTILDLDQALADMGMLTGQSREELHKIIPTLTDLAKETSSTITEVAELTTEYMKQGRTLKDSLELSKQTAKAAKIAGISVSESLEYMTSAINGFNLAATDSERVSDIFAKVGAATATDYEALAVALSKVSAQANTAGMSIEFTTTLLAKGIETTQEAPESIGTALKTILARMRELSDYGSSLEDNTSINKVERALGAVGIALRDTTGQFRDMEAIFTELGPKWKTLNSMQQQAIGQAVAGTRQQSRFLAIMQDWDRTLEISQQAEESAGATRYQYAKQAEGLAATLTRLTTAWQSFVQQFTNNNLIIQGAEVLEDILNKVNSVFEGLNKSDNKLSYIATLVLALTAIKGLLSHLLEPITSALAAVEKTSTAVQQIANAQTGVTQELQKELTLRERILGAIDNSNKEVAKSGKLEKSLFGIATKGLRDKIKNNKNLTKQAKNQLGYVGELTPLEKQQVKEKKKQLANELKLEKVEASKKLSKKKIVKNAQQEYDLSKEQVAKAEANLATTNDAVLKAKEELDLAKEKHNNSIHELAAADDIAAFKDRELATEQAEQHITAASNELIEKEKQYQQAITAQEQAQSNLEAAQNDQKTKKIALSNAELNKEHSIVGEKLKQFAFSVGSALTSFATMALAGTAIAAVTSLIGSIGGSIGGRITGSTAREQLSKNQQSSYENKETKATIKSLRDEYQELALKKSAGVLDQESAERMDEIADALAEQDPSIIGDDIVGAADAVIKKLDDDNKKLLQALKQNYLTINSKRFSKDNKEYLKSDEGISVFQDLAQEEMHALGYTDSSSNRILQQLTNSLNYERLVNSNTDMATLYKDVARIAGQYGQQIDSAYDNLLKQIQAYNEIKQTISNAEVLAAFKQNNTTLEVLSEQSHTVSNLMNLGWSTDRITAFSNSMVTLGASIEGVGNAMGILVKQANKSSKDVDAVYHNMLVNSLQYADRDWAQIFGDKWFEWDKTTQQSKMVQYRDQLKLLNTGMTLDQTSDKITNLSSVKQTSRDIAAKLKSNERLELTDYDTLEELGLMSDDAFITALTENPAKAAMLVLDKLNASTGDLENTIQRTIADEQVILKHNKSRLQELESIVLDGSGKLKIPSVDDTELTQAVAEYTALKNEIDLSKSAIATSQEKLKSLKDTIVDINVSSNQVLINNQKINELQEKIDQTEAGTLDTYIKINKLLEQNQDILQQKLHNEWQRLGDVVGLTAEDMRELFTYTEDGFVPAIKTSVEEWTELAGLTAEEVNWLLENLDIINETNASLEEQKQIQQEIQQQVIDSAIENQEYFMDIMITKYEKETEELQKNLDKRRELYEKYFDDLEGKDDTDNYETERQKLLNRIAKLSTATDSTSLAKLKEAQQELTELTDEYNSSQRDARREAITTRFDEQSEELDTNLEKLLANGNQLWTDVLKELQNPDGFRKMLMDNGFFDGKTTLQIEQYIEELVKKTQSVNSYNNALGTSNWSSDAIKQAVAAGLVSPTVNNGAISTQNNTTNNNITINGLDLSNTNYSESELKSLIDKSFEEAWNNILKQYGENPNLNPY